MRSRSTEQEDYLIRLIRQVGELARRLRERLTGSAEETATVRFETAQAVEQLLGPDGPLLSRVDAGTAIRLVGSPSRIALWLELLAIEAEACRLAGSNDEADALLSRMISLREAQERAESPK